MHRMGLGPAPIPIDTLSADRLADALRTLQQPAVAAAAAAAADRICTVGNLGVDYGWVWLSLFASTLSRHTSSVTAHMCMCHQHTGTHCAHIAPFHMAAGGWH